MTRDMKDVALFMRRLYWEAEAEKEDAGGCGQAGAAVTSADAATLATTVVAELTAFLALEITVDWPKADFCFAATDFGAALFDFLIWMGKNGRFWLLS